MDFLHNDLTFNNYLTLKLNEVKFENIHLGMLSGQHNFVLRIFDNNVQVGAVEYADYQDEAYINMIQVSPEHVRKGYAKHMIRWLAKEYEYENIHWGVTTPEGQRLKQSMDKEFKR